MTELPRAHAVDTASLGQWCVEHLGSPPAETLFTSAHLSVVIGLRLADGREVVVKIRPDSPRIAACVEVQRHMFEAGYPCPEPLTGVAPFGGHVATAETYVPGGAMLPTAAQTAAPFAAAFAWLIRLAPLPVEASTLEPPPSWTAWSQGGDRLWPRPDEDPGLDLNEAARANWLDDVARRARARLRVDESKVVIGHCDWIAANLRWNGDSLLVVHDWDSLIVESEAVLVGYAAALFPTSGGDEQATVEDTEQFILAYCQARGREFSAGERERAWAAGAWTRAYDAKFQHVAGLPITSLSEREAHERLRRAGIER